MNVIEKRSDANGVVNLQECIMHFGYDVMVRTSSTCALLMLTSIAGRCGIRRFNGICTMISPHLVFPSHFK